MLRYHRLSPYTAWLPSQSPPWETAGPARQRTCCVCDCTHRPGKADQPAGNLTLRTALAAASMERGTWRAAHTRTCLAKSSTSRRSAPSATGSCTAHSARRTRGAVTGRPDARTSDTAAAAALTTNQHRHAQPPAHHHQPHLLLQRLPEVLELGPAALLEVGGNLHRPAGAATHTPRGTRQRGGWSEEGGAAGRGHAQPLAAQRAPVALHPKPDRRLSARGTPEVTAVRSRSSPAPTTQPVPQARPPVHHQTACPAAATPARASAPSTPLPAHPPVHKLRHLLKVGLDEAAGGEGGGAHAQAAGHHGAHVACGGWQGRGR